jgi:hypothetical protein
MNAKGIIRRLDRTGDTQLAEWDLTEESLAEVEEIFATLTADSARPLIVRSDDGTSLTGRKITAFDPLADEILVFPQFAGG